MKRRPGASLRRRIGIRRHDVSVRVEALEDRRLLSGAATSYGQLPLGFEVNQGQVDRRVQFLAHGPGYSLFVTPNQAVLGLQATATTGTALRMQLVGADASARAVGLDRLAGVSNYLAGNDPSKWHTNIANYASVREQGVYKGVDLTYHGDRGRLEYDFTFAPHADPGLIRLAFQGAGSKSLDAQGNLVLRTPGGDVVEHAPVLYQEIGGVRHAVAGRYVFEKGGLVGFAVGEYDAGHALVIDPTLAYSTYFGNGSGGGSVIATDAAGDVYLTGEGGSPDYPITPGAFQTT